MKIVLSIAGILLILTGLVWFFQGINLLPGSFMTGQPKWAVYGALTFLIGAGILLNARRFGRNPPAS